MKEFRLIIAGSRSFNDYMLLEQTCDYLLAGKVKAGYSITIVSGTTNGADTLGEQHAAIFGIMQIGIDSVKQHAAMLLWLSMLCS